MNPAPTPNKAAPATDRALDAAAQYCSLDRDAPAVVFLAKLLDSHAAVPADDKAMMYRNNAASFLERLKNCQHELELHKIALAEAQAKPAVPAVGGVREVEVDYSVPTPLTEAFMNRIDDSEIDLSQVRSHSADLECEVIALRRALAALAPYLAPAQAQADTVLLRDAKAIARQIMKKTEVTTFELQRATIKDLASQILFLELAPQPTGKQAEGVTDTAMLDWCLQQTFTGSQPGSFRTYTRASIAEIIRSSNQTGEGRG